MFISKKHVYGKICVLAIFIYIAHDVIDTMVNWNVKLLVIFTK